MLMEKDKTKGKITSNYQAITCLPLVWKLLTGILVDEIYDCLKRKCYYKRNRWGADESERRWVIYCFLTKLYFGRCE